jgi:hypothetical protein
MEILSYSRQWWKEAEREEIAAGYSTIIQTAQRLLPVGLLSGLGKNSSHFSAYITNLPNQFTIRRVF